MSKLDKNQRIRTSKPKQDFDLSHDYLFTATTGQLRPVSHDLVQAGDYVKGKFNFFLRTMPLSTAAMVDVDFMVDYFFVPMELIWLPFGAWWSQTRSFPFVNAYDFASGDFNIFGPNTLPLVRLEEVWQTINDLSVNEKWQSYRLMDDLGLSGMFFTGDSAFVNHSGDDPVAPSIFPWQLCAYNCIYQHFYRNEEREAFKSQDYSLGTNGSGIHSFTSDEHINLKMRYLNRMDDYFTASKLSPLVANINNNPSFLGNFDISLGQNGFGFDNLIDYNSGFPDSNLSPNNVFNEGSTYNTHNSSNDSRAINQLRALFAEEKLLHVMNMTNKNYDSQVLARLGYDVPKDVKHEVMHLGHDTCQLNVQEIVSGSNTFTGESGSALGDLAGQGKAFSKDFKGFAFTAPCHGVVMTIWTCRVRPKYTASALRKDMMSEITDFFTPELDDLGMQPQYLYETRLAGNYKRLQPDTETPLGTIYANPYTITGWNYRYEYLKRNINRSSLAFMRAYDGIEQQQGVEIVPSPSPAPASVGYNSYTQWSSARIPLDNAFVNRTESIGLVRTFEDDYYSRPHNDLYKVLPNELDNVMLVSWLYSSPLDDSQVPVEDWRKHPWLAYQRDPFIVDGRFECHKRSAMSLYSMPKFI